MTDVVVIRPSNDPIDNTLSLWVDLMLPPGTGLPGVSVLSDLNGPAQATPAAVQAACATGDVIVYFGHGTESTLGDPTLLDTVTITHALGQHMVAMACLSAETFGPNAVTGRHLSSFLGFSEPLFVYNAVWGLFGYEVSQRIGAYLTGSTTMTQAADDLRTDLQGIEALYHTGAESHLADAPLIWMGARMNWRGLDVS